MSVLNQLRERVFACWRTHCPLCELTSHAGLLCAGCEEDCYASRQRRLLCVRCANDRSDSWGHCSELDPETPRLPLFNASRLSSNWCDNGCDNWCDHCRDQPPPQAYACAALDYGFPAQLLIVDFKLRGQLSLARPLAHLMLKSAQAVIQAQRPEAWVAVPASAQRLQQLGFSPPQQLAWHMSRLSGIALRTSWLTRIRDTAPQKSRSRAERQTALAHSLLASPSVRGRWVGVVDDVMTTGSTFAEASRALLAAGARGVTAVAAMRTS